MEALTVRGLRKRYDRFELKDVSFSLRPGLITGFIGRNGAGKTTTLKSLLNFVHPDAGEVLFWGKPFVGNELEIKQDIGCVPGAIGYYPTKKLKVISGVNRHFFKSWDQSAYEKFMDRFELDEDKTPAQLSEGMKVKYALALALSHRARLLILDEPTSGLDPVSRDELLEVFLRLIADEQVTILFSTHITSDLEKCADDIIYIRGGEIVQFSPLDELIAQYLVVHLTQAQASELAGKLIGPRPERKGVRALVRSGEQLPADVEAKAADLETIMIHLEGEKL